MDEATAKLMADKGIWLSIQPFLDDEDAVQFPPGSIQQYKKAQVIAGTDRAYGLREEIRNQDRLRHRHSVFAGARPSSGRDARQADALVHRAELLKMATSVNAELLALSGLRSPYPGKLGVVEEGALADLILVDGNPLENIQLIADPAKNFFIIMKDGKVAKNLLSR